MTVIPPTAGNTADTPFTDEWRWQQGVYGFLKGQVDWGDFAELTSYNSNSRYVLTVQNQGTGGHINVPGILAVQDSGVAAIALGVINNLTVGGDTALTGGLTVGGATILHGTTVFGDLSVTGALGVSGPSTFNTVTVATGNLTLTAGDIHLANQHTLFGTTTGASATNLASIDNSNNVNLSASAVDTALSGNTIKLYDSASTAQLTVPTHATPGVRIERLGVGTGPSATHELDVSGSAQISNALTINAGGMGVTGNSVVVGAFSVTGAFAANGATAATRITLTGAKGGNAALASVVALLVSFGLATDSTSA